MDELARRYLLLGLRLERISPGLLDSYVGPPELREVADSEALPLPEELHDEAMALAGMAADLPGTDPATERRRVWFAGQLRAMSAHARRAGGEEIAYLDLVEELIGIRALSVPDARLLAVGERLDAALPGGGSVPERIARLRDRLRIPPEGVVDAIRGSAERFRSVTRRDFELPPGEEIDWEEAHDEPWGAFATYAGHRRTRILVNVDLPVEVSGAAFLASHEAYPGHHVDHVVKDRTLIEGAGLGEAMLRTMGTPEATLAEGLADLGREVVMTDRELEAELRRIGRGAGVEGDWAAAVVVRNGLNELQSAVANAGILLHQDGLPEPEVRDYLAAVGLVPADRLDHVLRALRDPVRGMFFPYTEGARLIRPWLELQGQTTGFWRLLSEQLSPAALLADLEAAGAGDADPFPVGGPAA